MGTFYNYIQRKCLAPDHILEVIKKLCIEIDESICHSCDKSHIQVRWSFASSYFFGWSMPLQINNIEFKGPLWIYSLRMSIA